MGSGLARLYYNGNVVTLDGGGRASGVLTEGGIIRRVFAGEVRESELPDKVERVDLKGRTVLPGFTDSHIHFTWYARNLARIDLTGTRSKEEVLEALRANRGRYKKGEWVQGRGWSHNGWADASLPGASDIDEIFPDNPVKLSSKCGHIYWVNGAALRAAKIGKETRVKGGEIELDGKTGEPTGIIKENAEELIDAVIPDVPRGELKELILKAQGELHRLGITSMHVMETVKDFSLLHELHSEGKLKLRTCFYYPYGRLDELVRLKIRSGFGDDWLRIGGIKLLLDGSLGGRTAWMYEG